MIDYCIVDIVEMLPVAITLTVKYDEFLLSTSSSERFTQLVHKRNTSDLYTFLAQMIQTTVLLCTYMLV
uniref:Ovule protein n=1 Tax=Heterorhabditis bacteriophora TaxID=37862 RepID=A0A1I7W6G2_HETBA